MSESPSDSWVALTELSPGEAGTFQHIGLSGVLRLRLMDLGFTPGVGVELVRKGPGGKLLAVRIRGTVMAIRSSDAAKLLIVRG